MEKTIELSNTQKEITCSLKYNFSHIRLKKILVSFDDNMDNWFNLINKASPYLLVEYEDQAENITKNYPKQISSLISPNHKNPIFILDEKIPYENSKNMSTFGSHYDTLKIALKFGKNSEINEKIKISLVYEDTPGVEFI